MERLPEKIIVLPKFLHQLCGCGYTIVNIESLSLPLDNKTDSLLYYEGLLREIKYYLCLTMFIQSKCIKVWAIISIPLEIDLEI